MLKIAICDDNHAITSQLKQWLLGYQAAQLTITTFSDATSLLSGLEATMFDGFILDIELPDQSGIVLATTIRRLDANVPIIFLTSYTQYMEDVFKVQTFDYLVKPITQVTLFKVMDRVIRYLNLDQHTFQFTADRLQHQLNLNHILLFEKRGRQVLIRTIADDFTANLSTAAILDQVSADFVQVHTSFIINARFLTALGKKIAIIEHGNRAFEVPISRKFKESAETQLMIQLRKRL